MFPLIKSHFSMVLFLQLNSLMLSYYCAACAPANRVLLDRDSPSAADRDLIAALRPSHASARLQPENTLSAAFWLARVCNLPLRFSRAYSLLYCRGVVPFRVGPLRRPIFTSPNTADFFHSESPIPDGVGSGRFERSIGDCAAGYGHKPSLLELDVRPHCTGVCRHCIAGRSMGGRQRLARTRNFIRKPPRVCVAELSEPDRHRWMENSRATMDSRSPDQESAHGSNLHGRRG